MFGLMYLPILLALGLLIIGVVILVAVAATRGDRTPAGAEERAVRGVRAIALVAGVAAGAWVMFEPNPLDRGLGSSTVVAPLVLGIVVLLGVVCGELLVRPRYATDTRSATMRPRHLRDHLPARVMRLVVAMTVAAVLLCTYTLITASTDDMGRAGRALIGWCSADLVATRGPYPGSFYVLPYLAGLAVAAAVAAGAGLLISRRSLGAGPEAADRYRRTGLAAVVGAYGLTLAAPLAGIAFYAGTALLSHDCPQTGWRAVGVAALVLTVCAVGTALVSLVALVAPSTVAAIDVPRKAETEAVRG